MNKKILDHFKKTDLILFEAAKTMDIQPLIKVEDFYADLVETIINQQLSGKAAATIFGRLNKLLKNETVSPKNVLAVSDETMRTAGISYSKIKYIKGLSEAVLKKQIDLNSLDAKDDETVMSELIKLKGIGKWSAEMFLMFTLGREDVFSFGDLGS